MTWRIKNGKNIKSLKIAMLVDPDCSLTVQGNCNVPSRVPTPHPNHRFQQYSIFKAF